MPNNATADTMLAWERFLTGHPRAVVAACNFVVSSWQRSLALGVDPTSFSAPLPARGEAMRQLRLRHRELLAAAEDVFAQLSDLFTGSRSIILLTDPDGVVLEAAGDLYTLEEGQDIHLMQGGNWNEAVVGTNGIGTALATGRRAQVHAAEHFCEGIKRWTCAAAPIYDPATGAILGVLDISGPPATYQRNNLALAVATARQIEASVAARAARDRACLLEACLQRLSATDAAGLIAIDRNGRLVHNTGRIVAPVALGERVPGLDATLGVEEWANLLPEPWRAEWFRPVAFQGRAIGAVLVVPEKLSARPSVKRDAAEGNGFDAIIGTSPAMQAVMGRARRLAPRRVPVLIEGETGVGKELFARALHGTGRFVAFNCGAASRELLAGELFGHVRGAFTGATSEGRAGRFELAHGGTLCLDEIGELPLDLQPVLLRVLEDGVVYRLGDTHSRQVDVRLITMTNRDLRKEVEQGRFRRDLFHRIAVTTLTVPPLRERGEDVDRLTDYFNILLSQRHHVPPLVFPAEIRQVLRAQPWPGNVRELRNLVENLLLSGADPVVTFNDLSWLDASTPKLGTTTTLDDAEHQAISRALQQCGGSITAAARLLEISRSTLYRKMERYNLHAAEAARSAQNPVTQETADRRTVVDSMRQPGDKMAR